MPSHKPAIPVLIAAVAAAALGGAAACAADIDHRATYERIKALAGTWSGRMEDPLAGEPVSVRYEVVSGGKAVVEYQYPGKVPGQVTVYFMAGDQLHATHYSGAGNQPAWRLSRKSTPELALMEFAGGTGFNSDKDGHVHRGEIRFVSPDRIEQKWFHFVGPKEQGATHWFLERAQRSAQPAPRPQ